MCSGHAGVGDVLVQVGGRQVLKRDGHLGAPMAEGSGKGQGVNVRTCQKLHQGPALEAPQARGRPRGAAELIAQGVRRWRQHGRGSTGKLDGVGEGAAGAAW